MNRCAGAALAAILALAVALPAAAEPRPFPPQTLRGELLVEQPPDVRLNGQPARLAPGARIRGEDNLLRLSGTLVGQKLTVHYTLDNYGLLRDVWLLTVEEKRIQPWPRTPAEAGSWTYDPLAKRWSRP
jgi:hypothetical protein